MTTQLVTSPEEQQPLMQRDHRLILRISGAGQTLALLLANRHTHPAPGLRAKWIAAAPRRAPTHHLRSGRKNDSNAGAYPDSGSLTGLSLRDQFRDSPYVKHPQSTFVASRPRGPEWAGRAPITSAPQTVIRNPGSRLLLLHLRPRAPIAKEYCNIAAMPRWCYSVNLSLYGNRRASTVCSPEPLAHRHTVSGKESQETCVVSKTSIGHRVHPTF